jgi:hypothetical protein
VSQNLNLLLNFQPRHLRQPLYLPSLHFLFPVVPPELDCGPEFLHFAELSTRESPQVSLLVSRLFKFLFCSFLNYLGSFGIRLSSNLNLWPSFQLGQSSCSLAPPFQVALSVPKLHCDLRKCTGTGRIKKRDMRLRETQPHKAHAFIDCVRAIIHSIIPLFHHHSSGST